VVATFQASASERIYLNGVLDKEQTSGVLAVLNGSNSASYKIALRDGTTEYFAGSLDDVRIYNRALSNTEILQLYNLGR